MLLLPPVSHPSLLIWSPHPCHLPRAQERSSAALCLRQQTGKKHPATPSSSSSLKQDGVFNASVTQVPSKSQSQRKGNGAVQGEIRAGASVSWEMGSAPTETLHLPWSFPTFLAKIPRVALARGQTHCKPKIKNLTCSEVFLFLSY